jgi:hypothetical protein
MPSDTSAASREKRVRRQKTYDEDFVVYPAAVAAAGKSGASHVSESKEASLGTEDASWGSYSNGTGSGGSGDLMAPKYQVGDLVWAKVSGHPWWPCMVSRDTTGESSSSMASHVKEVGTTRTKRTFYVEFFGPAVEHAWVAEGCLIEYRGIEAFKTYAQDQVDQAPTKSAKEKLAERFQLKVALTRRDHWETAVEEADEALTKKRADDRMLIIMRKKSTDENEENVTPVSRAKSGGDKVQHAQAQTQQENRAARSRTRLSLEVPKAPASAAATGAAGAGAGGAATKRKRVASVANSDDMAPSPSAPSSAAAALKIKRTDSANDEVGGFL